MTVLCYLYKKSPDFKLMLIYNNLQLYITTCIIYNLQVVYFIIKSVYIGNQIGHVFKMSAPIRPYSRNYRLRVLQKSVRETIFEE